MLSLENYTNFFIYRHRYVISTIFLVIIAFLLLFVQLGTLLPGIAPSEAQSALQAQSLQSITDNPIHAPYKLLQNISLRIFGGSAFGIRIVSAALGAATLAVMYTLFLTWHRRRIAVLGMALLVGSSWFLNIARLGTPDILLPLMVLILMSILTYIHHSKATWYNMLFLSIGFAFVLYSPYTIYFILLALLLYYKEGIAAIKKINPWFYPVIVIFFLIILAPLLFAFIKDPSLIRIWLGIPPTLPSITQYFDNITHAFAHIFWRSSTNATLHLGNLAMLDIFTASMTALGLYHYERHLDRLKTRYILSGFLLAFFVVALSGDHFAYALFIPFVYIIAATGVVTLINQWNNIFPRNPIARTAAVIPITMVLLVTISYHTSRYFIAWPRTPETKRVFATEPTLLRQDILRQNMNENNILVISTGERFEQTKASLIGLENNRQLIVINAENEIANTQNFDLIYVEPAAINTEISQTLNKTPISTITSARQTSPIAYRIYEPLTQE